MPPRAVPFREVQRKLETAGFSVTSQRGSHVKFAKQTANGIRTAIVPRHREIARGTLGSIIRQAGLTPEDFDRL